MIGAVRHVRGSLLVLAVLSTAACAGEEHGPNGELKLHGTVHMVQAQDGATCWKFDSKKGKSYELQPAQAPRDLLVDGATAVLLVKPRSGGSFCGIGNIVDIVKADSIGGGGSSSN